jgi:hypothetical protein
MPGLTVFREHSVQILLSAYALCDRPGGSRETARADLLTFADHLTSRRATFSNVRFTPRSGHQFRILSSAPSRASAATKTR